MFCRSVHLVDEDASVRLDLVRSLGALEVEAWPFPGPAPFLAMLSHLPPAPVLFGLRADSPAAGFELLAALAANGLGWPAVAMSAESDTRTAVEAMKRGAIDFLEVPVRTDRLEEALAAAGDLLERSARERGTRRAVEERLASLSPRELEVARALAGGMGNKIVAHHLGLSVRTVEMHRSKLLRKLEVRTLAEAAVLLAQAEESPTALLRARRGRLEERPIGPPSP